MTAPVVSHLRRLLETCPAALRALDAVYLIELRDSGACWTLDATADPPSLRPGRPEVHDCGIAAESDDLVRVLADPGLALQLSFEGRLSLSGNTALAARFGAAIGLALAVPERSRR